MKRYTTLALSTIGLLAFAVPAFAIDGTTTDPGAQVEILDTTGGTNASLTYNPSPGVIMSWYTFPGSFALAATNMSASISERNAYGLTSDYNGYYQTRYEDSGATDPAPPPVVTWDPGTQEPSATNFTGWQQMGGGATGS